MLVSKGGDPERDDYGLPPVDIEIPDDARELDRDVQAYHRELRAQRRQRLLHRLGGSITRDGMVLPMLAGCLALTLLAGTLLTMFTARRAAPPLAQTTATPRSARPAVGQSGSMLPDAIVLAGSKTVRVRALGPAVLLLVPVPCRCTAAARRLVSQAAQANVGIYLVAAGRAVARARSLARQNRMRAGQVLTDSQDTLGDTYKRTGLTAILVFPDGSVSNVEPALGPAVQLEPEMAALRGSTPVGLVSPFGSVLAANQAGLNAA
jgi:hypothetical protein